MPASPGSERRIDLEHPLYDYLVVGAGLAGSTLAERLASELGAAVLVIDKRSHIAGNTYDPLDEHGLRYHAYGPHIFHTNSAAVVEYLGAFTRWRPYEHRVVANVDGKLVPLPINRTTVNALYDLDLDEAGVAEFLAARAVPFARIDTSEQTILSRVGRELYETFFRGYTRKQWGIDPSQLDATVCGRIPTRTGDDDRYFTESFQAMPAGGYAAMIASMLDRPNIDVVTGMDYRTAVDSVRFKHVIYTGPIDEFFDERFGKLPYRSLRFEFETRDVEWAQSAGCVNEPSESVPYTRTTEYKHLTGQSHAKTILSREYPVRRRRPVLSDTAPGQPRALPQVRGARGAAARRHVRRPARGVQVLQHGPGRRVGARRVRRSREDRVGCFLSCGLRRSAPSRE